MKMKVFGALFLSGISLTQIAIAQLTWNGAGSDANWSTGGNWVGSVAPSGDEQLVFSGTTKTANTNDLGALDVLSMDFFNGPWTISGDALNLGGTTADPSEIKIRNGVTATIKNDIHLNPGIGNKELTVEVNGAQAILEGAVDGSGRSLVKLGPGKLTAKGDLTYTGDTQVRWGTFQLANNDLSSMSFYIGTSNVNNKIFDNVNAKATTAILWGKFIFDLSNASTNVADSWTIVDYSTIDTVDFNYGFKVDGFTETSSGIWDKTTAAGVSYRFEESLGVLSVVAGAPDPFPAITVPAIVQNADFNQTTNTTASVPWNVTDSFGDFTAFYGKFGEVISWQHYYGDPNGLTAQVGEPGIDNSGDDPVPALEGQPYLDTLYHNVDGAGRIVLNSASNYRNGMVQTNILDGLAISSTIDYEFVIEASQNHTASNNLATMTAALTVGTNVQDLASAVSGSVIQSGLTSLETADVGFSSFTNVISGADLLAAQSAGQVNMIFDIINTDSIPGVSQLIIQSLCLNPVLDRNDLNKDGFVNEQDYYLAQLYLDGNGGDSAAVRQSALIDAGYTPAEALDYLNLTAFDLNSDGIFNEFDVGLVEAEVVGPLTLKVSGAGAALDFEWKSLVVKKYDLEFTAGLTSPSWDAYNDGVMTYTNMPGSGTGSNILSGVLLPGTHGFFRVSEKD